MLFPLMTVLNRRYGKCILFMLQISLQDPQSEEHRRPNMLFPCKTKWGCWWFILKNKSNINFMPYCISRNSKLSWVIALCEFFGVIGTVIIVKISKVYEEENIFIFTWRGTAGTEEVHGLRDCSLSGLYQDI